MWWHDRDELALNLLTRDATVDAPVGASEPMQAESPEPEWFSETGAEPDMILPENPSAESRTELEPSAVICTCNPGENIEIAALIPAANPVCEQTALALYDPNFGRYTPPVQEVAEVVETAAAFIAADLEPQTEALSVSEMADAAADPLPVASAQEEPILASLLTFYGLSEQPFQVTPDPAYLYLSEVHREALTSLSQGVQDLRGFMALIAEPGMGKTTLLNKLMEELRDSARIVFLFQTQCNSRELLRYLLGELGVESSGIDVVAMHRKLNEQLFQEMLQGRRFVLIVDEAQNLQDSVLETIRLLSDFETTHRKLIQIVLAGQPQLADTLMRPSLSQLRQRIAILTSLAPLSAAETARYVEHRLRAAGLSGELVFTEDALAILAERSKGTPRSINNLCFNALQMGYSEGSKTIDSKIIERVAGKLDLESLRRPQPQPVEIQPTSPPVPDISSQLASVLLAALTREAQPNRACSSESQPKASATLTGKVTEKVKSRSWSQDRECRIQVSLGREASAEIPVADRYYCCSFYVDEAQAALLQTGQPVKIKLEQE